SLIRNTVIIGVAAVIVVGLIALAVIKWRQLTGQQSKTTSEQPVSFPLKQTLTGHNNGIMPVGFPRDGKTLASGSMDKTIKFWDAQTGALKQTLTGHDEVVKTVAFSPDGTILASGSDDKTIKCWDVQTGALRQTLTGHSNGIHAVAFSSDGKTLASGS